MARALGVGGIFFKSPDPAKLQGWYAQWLGIDAQGDQGMAFAIFQPGTMPENSYTVWSMFDSGTTYFAPSSKEFMFNLVIDNYVKGPSGWHWRGLLRSSGGSPSERFISGSRPDRARLPTENRLFWKIR
jgi:hypothetical protein